MEKRSTPSLQITDRFGAQTAFASLRLPDGMPDTRLVEAALAQGVVVRALSGYYASREAGTDCHGLVLGYGMAESAQIAGLVRRLVDCVPST